MPYQSSTISKDIDRDSHFVDTKDGINGVPFGIDTSQGFAMPQSIASYHNPKLPMYRLAGYTLPAVWADHFDWDTELQFQVQRFDAEFGARYTEENVSIPSYDETRLIYGR